MDRLAVVGCAYVLMLSLPAAAFASASSTVEPRGPRAAAKTTLPKNSLLKNSNSKNSLPKSATVSSLKAQTPVFDKMPTSVDSTARMDSTASGPVYGRPFADTIDREAAAQSQTATSAADPSADPSADSSGQTSDAGNSASNATLAPFRRANNSFASLRGMQLPRPLNMPANASPALKQAAALIPNMSVVSPNLVRGSQPSVPSLALLKEAGVKTIVNLRNEPILVAQEAGAAKRAGLNYVNIPMALFETPTRQQFQKFLSTVDNNGPVFVHCQMGEDRTGTMVAVYRMAREGWDVNRAYQEMTAMGFKTLLASLSGAVFDYSASLGHPARRPMPDFGGISSIFRH